jgi:AraC-like DNA-binding protein
LDDVGLGAVLAVTLRDHCPVEIWPAGRAEADAIAEANPAAVVASAPRQAAELRVALGALLPQCVVLLRGSERRPSGPGQIPSGTLHQFFRDVVTALGLSPDVKGRMLEMPGAVMSVLEYVSVHYGRPIRLPIIAAVSSTSPRYLLRTFQRCMALTVKQFVTRVRVHVALFHLARTDENLESLAERVGFADASHLSRVLLRYTGRRPGEHRIPHA